LGRVSFAKSPMTGTIVKVNAAVGQRIKAGETIVIVESMKMEFMVRATHDVTVKEVRVAPGQFVNMNDKVVIFEDEPEN